METSVQKCNQHLRIASNLCLFAALGHAGIIKDVLLGVSAEVFFARL